MHLIAVDTLECLGHLVGLACSSSGWGCRLDAGDVGAAGCALHQRGKHRPQLIHNLGSRGPAPVDAAGRVASCGDESQLMHMAGHVSSTARCHLSGHASQDPPRARDHADTPGAGVLGPAAGHEVLQAGGYAWGHIGAVLVLRHLDDDLHAGEVSVQLLPAAQLPHCTAGKQGRGRQAVRRGTCRLTQRWTRYPGGLAGKALRWAGWLPASQPASHQAPPISCHHASMPIQSSARLTNHGKRVDVC
jgi:hypothetical protein